MKWLSWEKVTWRFISSRRLFSFLSISASIVYVISAPASPVLGFLVDKTGRNVIWVLIAVVTTLAAHMMLAFTFWNPWIAMVMDLASLFTVLLLTRHKLAYYNRQYISKYWKYSSGDMHVNVVIWSNIPPSWLLLYQNRGFSCISVTERIPTHSPVCTGCLLLLTGLCSLANGGLCGSRASTGDGLWLVSTWPPDIQRADTHLSGVSGVICLSACSPSRTWDWPSSPW